MSQSTNDNEKQTKKFLKNQSKCLDIFIKEQEKSRKEFIKEQTERLNEFLDQNNGRLNEFKSYIYDYNCGFGALPISKILSFSISQLCVDGLHVTTYSLPYPGKSTTDISFKLTKKDFDEQITNLYIKNSENPQILVEYLRKNEREYAYKNYHENDKNILNHFTPDEIRFYLPLCFNYTHDPEYIERFVTGQLAKLSKEEFDAQDSDFPDTPKSFWSLFGW